MPDKLVVAVAVYVVSEITQSGLGRVEALSSKETRGKPNGDKAVTATTDGRLFQVPRLSRNRCLSLTYIESYVSASA